MGRAFRLILYLLSIHRLHPGHAMALYANAVEVVADEPSLFNGDDGKFRTLLVVLDWAARESGGNKTATGKAGDCGRLQLLFPPSRQGHSCEEIRTAKDLDLRLGLAWMVKMRDVCGGSVRKGLAAFARGSCLSVEGLKIADFRLGEVESVP